MNKKFEVKTRGHYDFIDITSQVADAVAKSEIKDGLVLVFVCGSTAAITTMEYEEGLIEDIKKTLEKLAPESGDYEHHKRWGDFNGAAHIKNAIIGSDLTVPVANSKLQLGTWQQIVLIDFDERARTREVVINVVK